MKKRRAKKVNKIRIGTRGSELALYQANKTLHALNSLGFEGEIVVIKTSGDKIKSKPLIQFGGKGLFVKEIQEALLHGTIDIAVHSLKDYPIENPDELTLGSILEREDVRDAIVLKRENQLNGLSKNSKVGTGSLRRKYQLKLLKPNWEILPLRGNVGTRIRKVEEGKYDAVILASAGLKRLKKEEFIKGYFDVSEMVPAVGQGAIAIEAKKDNYAILEILKKIESEKARKEIDAERNFLRRLGGSCTTPLGVNARIEDEKIKICAYLSSFKNDRWIKDEIEGNLQDAIELSNRLFEFFAIKGAKELV
jgi:hydroxymethylbilane synthase